MTPSSSRPSVLLPQQRGAALIIGLIMLLILSLLGVAAMSNISLQEKMTGSLLDRNRAFQAAETALRRAEDYVRNRNGARSDELVGSARFDLNISASGWPDPNDFAGWEGNYLLAPDIDGMPTPARYRLELQIKDSDSQPSIHRISAIGFGQRASTRVVLHSTFVDLDF